MQMTWQACTVNTVCYLHSNSVVWVAMIGLTMPCRSQLVEHSPKTNLVQLQFCSVLLPPSSSSCTSILLFPIPFSDLFFTSGVPIYMVVLFFCSQVRPLALRPLFSSSALSPPSAVHISIPRPCFQRMFFGRPLPLFCCSVASTECLLGNAIIAPSKNVSKQSPRP